MEEKDRITVQTFMFSFKLLLGYDKSKKVQILINQKVSNVFDVVLFLCLLTSVSNFPWYQFSS